METVKDEKKTLTEYKREIIDTIETIMQSECIDLKEDTAQTWLYVLGRLHDQVFCDIKQLKINIYLPSYSKYNFTNNNQFNTPLLCELVRYMVMLGHKFNKPFNIACASILLGINKDTFYKWQYINKKIDRDYIERLNLFNYIDVDTYIYNQSIDDIEKIEDYKVLLIYKGFEIWEILQDNNENVLRSKLLDSRQPLAQITLLNHDHGYNMPSATNGTATAQRLTLDNLPSLSVGGEQPPAITATAGQPQA